jgi:hypothetical protein
MNDPIIEHDKEVIPFITSPYSLDCQHTIQALHHRIDKLQKRLDSTKMFCDSLWEALRDYER